MVWYKSKNIDFDLTGNVSTSCSCCLRIALSPKLSQVCSREHLYDKLFLLGMNVMFYIAAEISSRIPKNTLCPCIYKRHHL